MEKQPLVSIVVPAHNCKRTIRDTIESVIKQTYSNWELIVIEDCSTDNTYKLLQDIEKKEKRMHLYKNDINMGVADSRNKGVETAKGEFIAFLDSDDMWLSEKLEKQIELMVKNDAALSCTSYTFIDEKGSSLPNKVTVPTRINLNMLIKKNIIGCSTVIVKKDIISKYKMSNEFYSEDYAAWLKILKECDIAYGLKKEYTQYRFMRGTKSSNKIMSGLKLYPLYRKLLKMGPFKSIYHLILYFFYGLFKYNKLFLNK